MTTCARLARSAQRLLVPRAGTVGFSVQHGSLPLLHIQGSRFLSSTTVSLSQASAVQLKGIEEVSPPADKQVLSFETMRGKISKEIVDAITGSPMHLKNMTPVQEAVLTLLPGIAEPYEEAAKDGTARDLLVRAKTGTGKTLAFLIPAIEARIRMLNYLGKQAAHEAGRPSDHTLINNAKKTFARDSVGALIVSPTRELASQIVREAQKITYGHFEVHSFVGGMDKGPQVRHFLKGRKDIVVGTPGRILDLVESNPSIRQAIAKTRTLILDEADTLLDLGFRDDIERIIKCTPPSPERQTFLFSATVNARVEQIARASLNKRHVFINTVSDDSSPVHAHIPQYHTVLPSAREQLPHVLRLLAQDQLENLGTSKVIVFLPTTKMTMLYSTYIRELAPVIFPAGRATMIEEIHSKRTQSSRTRASDRFRRSTAPASILITSDVSARGVDYPGVTRVIQVGVPSTTEQYIHRVGRTGRAGSVGRGDLVLLPFEEQFVFRELKQVPLKPVTYEQVQKKTIALAEQFDADPELAFEKTPLPKIKKFSRSMQPMKFAGPVLPKINAIDDEVTQLLSSVDETAVEETMLSLIGFYLGRCTELNISKSAVVEELKDWAVKAGGLPHPPRISAGFLAKLGIRMDRISDRSKPRFGIRKGSWDDEGNERRFGRKSERGAFDYAEDEGRNFGKRDSGRRRDSDFGSRSGGFGRRDRDRDERHSWPAHSFSGRSSRSD